MKKRFLLFALAAIVVLMSMVFAGCNKSAPADNGGGGSPAPAAANGENGSTAPAPAPAPASGDEYDTYMAAATALNNAENVSMEMSTQTTMKIAGQTMDITVSGLVQLTRTDGKLEMQMDEKMGSAGQEIPMTIYYKDGYMYMNMNGTAKMKMAQPEDELLQSQNVGAQVFDKQYVKDVKSEKAGDGTKLTFTVDGKGLDALVKSAENSLGSSADASLSEAGMAFGDATIIVTLDKSGAITNEDVTMSFTMKAGGEDVTADIHSVVNNIKIGGANITFPGDLDSYSEMPSTTGGSSTVG